MGKQTDLFIIGGGLAGLSLALQVRENCPDLDITLAETRAEALPRFTGKVGESTVEVGAHYLADVIGQREHLDEHQLRKFGLRFFFSEGCDDLSAADEVGVSNTFEIPTYQIERSSFEDHLVETAVAAGVNVLMGTRVTDVDMKEGGHTLCLKTKEQEFNVRAKWIVDASGRRSLVKKKLQLERPTEHQAGAVWFRLDRKVTIDDWSSSTDWRGKFGAERRWLSTNHLMGRGYWIWIIPLSGGATSVGVVFDENIHAAQNFSRIESTMNWMRERQPLCAAAIDQCEVLDYRLLKNFSYDTTQLFSENRWGLTGESGVFLDPFYSPGTDFIAYGNTFLTDLISRSKSGESIAGRSYAYQQVFESIARSTEQLYLGQYPGFFSQRLMSLKMVWDYSYYWGVLGLLFFSKSLTDLNQVRSMNPELMAIRSVNDEAQEMFRVYARANTEVAPQGNFVDQLEIPILVEFNKILERSDEISDASQIMRGNVEKLHRLIVVIRALLHGGSSSESSEAELVGDLASRLTV